MDFCNSELIKNNKALSKNKSAKQKCDGSSVVSWQWLCLQPETVQAWAQASRLPAQMAAGSQSGSPCSHTETHSLTQTNSHSKAHSHTNISSHTDTFLHIDTLPHRCTDTQTYTIDALTYRHIHIDILIHRHTHIDIVRYLDTDT